MLLHMTSSRAGIVINITSSPCLTYSPHSPTAFASSEWVSIYNPGNAAAVPVSRSITIIHCCPEHRDRYSTQTVLWEHRRHAVAMAWMKMKAKMLARKQFSAFEFGLVCVAAMGLTHYCSVLAASLVPAASGSKSHQPPSPPMSGLHGGSIFLPSDRFNAIYHRFPTQSQSTKKTNKYISASLVKSDRRCGVTLEMLRRSMKSGSSIDELKLHIE